MLIKNDFEVYKSIGVHIEAKKEASKRPWVAGFVYLRPKNRPKHPQQSLRCPEFGLWGLFQLDPPKWRDVHFADLETTQNTVGVGTHVAVLARKSHTRGALPAVVEAAVMGRNGRGSGRLGERKSHFLR